MGLRLLGFGLEIVAAVLAVLCARIRAHHRPVALVAVVLAASDVGRFALGYGRDVAGRVHPLEGIALALYHVDRAAWLAYPVAIAIGGVRLFVEAGARVGHLLGAYALACVALAATYPASRAPWVIPALHGIPLLVAIGCAIHWAQRKEWPYVTHVLALLGIVTEGVLYAGPLVSGRPRETWSVTVPLYLAAVGTSVAVHAVWLRNLRAERERGG